MENIIVLIIAIDVPRDMTDIIHEHTGGSTCPCFIYIGYREDDDVFYTDAYINLNLIKK